MQSPVGQFIVAGPRRTLQLLVSLPMDTIKTRLQADNTCTLLESVLDHRNAPPNQSIAQHWKRANLYGGLGPAIVTGWFYFGCIASSLAVVKNFSSEGDPNYRLSFTDMASATALATVTSTAFVAAGESFKICDQVFGMKPMEVWKKYGPKPLFRGTMATAAREGLFIGAVFLPDKLAPGTEAWTSANIPSLVGYEKIGLSLTLGGFFGWLSNIPDWAKTRIQTGIDPNMRVSLRNEIKSNGFRNILGKSAVMRGIYISTGVAVLNYVRDDCENALAAMCDKIWP